MIMHPIKKYLLISVSLMILTAISYAIDNPNKRLNLNAIDFSGKIQTSPTSRGSDTLDFGYVLAGDTVILPIYFVNDGSEALECLGGNFLRSLRPNPPRPNEELEFLVENFTTIFLDSTTRLVSTNALRFAADSSFRNIFPEGYREARLNVSLHPRGRQDTAVDRRRFVLKATKSFRPLWSDQNLTTPLRFDSVYVNPALPVRSVLRIYNTNRVFSSPVLADTITTSLTPQARSKFSFPDPLITLNQFARQPNIPFDITVQYAPTSRGNDILDIAFAHSKTNGIKDDTMRTRITGVGVEQSIKVVQIRKAGVRFIGDSILDGNDTLDFGFVRNQRSDTIEVIIENQGNLPFLSTGIDIEDITVNSSSQFSGAKRAAIGSSILPLRFDTLSIVFSPKVSGEIVGRYLIKSDIDSRVRGVPQSALTVPLIVRGIGTEPRPLALVSTAQFDSVAVYDRCFTDLRSKIPVRNAGNIPIQFTSITVNPSNSPFVVEKGLTVLNVGQVDTVEVRFSPRATGTFNSLLELRYEGESEPLTVNLAGKGVEPRTIVCSTPTQSTYLPGNKLSIPILIDKTLITLTGKFQADILYNSTMLGLSGYTNNRTASSGANPITINKIANGRIRCSIEMPNSFASSDTLIVLTFDTYLGTSIESEIAIAEPKFGIKNCESLLPVQVINGIVRADSVCDLINKIPSSLPTLLSVAVAPNPVSNTGQFVLKTTKQIQSISLKILNQQGMVVADVQSIQPFEENPDRIGYVSKYSFGLEELSTGVYTALVQVNAIDGAISSGFVRVIKVY
jgi:hypothetical protein